MRKWIALFSHTGSEIVNISKTIGKIPTKVITNQLPGSEDIHPGIKDFPEVIYTKNKPSVSDYEQLFDGNALISLHGWMRIVPGSVCESHEIWNLHPGLITKYPELKGADPQKKIFELDEPPEEVGCVIHRAVKEVDSGEVFMERSTTNVYYSEASLTKYLHEMATGMWIDFLNTKLYYHG